MIQSRKWDGTGSRTAAEGDFFEGLREDREAFLRICRPVTYRKGSFPFFQGDQDQKVFYIQTGQVKIIRVTPCGREAIVSLRYPGQVFGLAEAMGGDTRRASAQAVTEVSLQETGGPPFTEFLERHPKLAVRVAQVLSRRLRDLCQQIESLMVCNPTSRLIKLLLAFAEPAARGSLGAIRVPLALSQSELAAMIGSSRQTVNQILRGLEAEKLIDAGPVEISILDHEALLARWAATHEDPFCCATCLPPSDTRAKGATVVGRDGRRG